MAVYGSWQVGSPSVQISLTTQARPGARFLYGGLFTQRRLTPLVRFNRSFVSGSPIVIPLTHSTTHIYGIYLPHVTIVHCGCEGINTGNRFVVRHQAHEHRKAKMVSYVVTGASRGLGLQFTKTLAVRGSTDISIVTAHIAMLTFVGQPKQSSFCPSPKCRRVQRAEEPRRFKRERTHCVRRFRQTKNSEGMWPEPLFVTRFLRVAIACSGSDCQDHRRLFGCSREQCRQNTGKE